MKRTSRWKDGLLNVSIGLVSVLFLITWALHILRSPYTYYISETTFEQLILPRVESAIEDECLFYGLPTQLFSGEAFRSQLYRFTHLQMQTFASNEQPTVDSFLYREAVNRFLSEQSTEETVSQADVADEIGETIAQAAHAVITVPATITTTMRRLMDHPTFTVWARSYRFWGAVLICLILCTVGKQRSASRIYGASLAVAIGSTAVFVPLLLWERYDLFARWSLGESMLAWSLETFCEGKIQQLLLSVGIVTVIAIVCLFGSVIFVTKSSQSRD